MCNHLGHCNCHGMNQHRCPCCGAWTPCFHHHHTHYWPVPLPQHHSYINPTQAAIERMAGRR